MSESASRPLSFQNNRLDIVDLFSFPILLIDNSFHIIAMNRLAESLVAFSVGDAITHGFSHSLRDEFAHWELPEQSFYYRDQLVKALILRPENNATSSISDFASEVFIYSQMFWHSTQGMFQSTPEGTFIRVNPSFAEMLGYHSPYEMMASIKKMETDFYCDPELRAHFRKRVEASESIQGIEFEAWRKDKTTLFVSVHSRCVRDREGNVLYYEGTVEDVTRRKQAEEALAAVNLTLSLQAEALSNSCKELELFSNILAHDLAAPLRLISSYLPALEVRIRSNLSEQESERFTFVTEAAAHMRELIKGLLRYSKTQITDVPASPVSSLNCLALAIESLEDRIKEMSAKVTWDPLPEVYIQPAMLTDLFSNLLANALKYANTPCLEIHFSAEEKEDTWQFSVRDNGKGIAPDDQERIFLLYQRGSASNTIDGSGIGLAVCRKIVKGYGGRIWVESPPGKGTTFYFSLPKIRSNHVAPLA